MSSTERFNPAFAATFSPGDYTKGLLIDKRCQPSLGSLTSPHLRFSLLSSSAWPGRDYEVIVDGIIGPWFLSEFHHASGVKAADLRYVVLRPEGIEAITHNDRSAEHAVTHSSTLA